MPRRIRTGRNLPVAIGVGLGMGVLVVLTLYTVKATFLVYMGAAVAVAGWELNRALAVRHIRIALPPLAAGCAAMWTCAYWLGTREALAALALTVVAVLIWRLNGGVSGYLRDMTASIFALMYLPLMAVFVVLMLASDDGPDRLIVFIAVTVCSDVGGYFAGILLGRHLLAPAISPKKTWEGLGGSVVVCVGVGALLMPALLGGLFWEGMIVGAAAVAAATLGDLVESMMKRDLGIKDMGRVLPGHGGILDRIDSLLVNAPVAWLLLAVFVPAGPR
ncbi:MAG: phosphatidate cytidylyltransferase [Micromonosporaceae bacterium]